jgi:hypothetical protein
MAREHIVLALRSNIARKITGLSTGPLRCVRTKAICCTGFCPATPGRCHTLRVQLANNNFDALFLLIC